LRNQGFFDFDGDWLNRVNQQNTPSGQELVKIHLVVNCSQSALLKLFLSIKIDRSSLIEDTVYFAFSIELLLLFVPPNNILPNCFAVSFCMLGCQDQKKAPQKNQSKIPQ
jgi:hypothetical protein